MRNPEAKVTCPNDFVTCAGDRFHILYSPIVEKDGSINLVESGKDDIQEFIDSYRDQTDMSYILKQLALGNTSVLNQRDPMYGDFTSAPKTYAEALQMVMDAEKKFMTLPLDVRNKFDNDYRKWFATSGSDEWFAKMDSVIAKPSEPAEVVESEVKTNES